MSEATACNRCILNRIVYDAKQGGLVVTRTAGGIGTDVFVHPPGLAIDEVIRRRGEFLASSMMEISATCCC